MRINANSGPKLPPSKRSYGRPRTAPSAEMYRMRLSGMTYRAIGRQFKVTPERVFELCRREKREAGA